MELATPTGTDISQGDDDGRSVLFRSAWTLFDQGLSSLFSLVAGFAAARALSGEDFGVFATLFTSLLVARGVVKAVTLDPITIDHAGPQAERFAGHATAVTLATAATGALAALAVAAVSPRVTVTLALSCGAALLTLLAVDTSRMLDIAAGVPLRAALTSGTLAAVGLAVLVYTWSNPLGLAPLVGLLAAAAGAALAQRRRRWGSPPGPRALVSWLKAQRALAVPLLLEFLSNTGAIFLAVYLLAAIDLTEAGAYRAANMVAGPLYMIYVGIGQVVMTEASRAKPTAAGSGPESRSGSGSGGTDLGARVATWSLILSIVAAAVYLVVVHLTRDTIGDLLRITKPEHLGTFTGAVLLGLFNAPSFVAAGLLRAVARTRLLLVIRLISLVPVLTAVIAGAIAAGAAGTVRYGIIAELVNLPLWLAALAVGYRSRRRESVDAHHA